MSARPEGLLCGFGDIAAGLGGLAWDLGEPAALQLERGEVRTGSFALEEGGDAATAAISAGGVVLEAVLAPGIDPVALEPANGGGAAMTVTPCRAEVRLEGAAETVECPGQITRWIQDPLKRAGTFRHLAIASADGALLVATALGASGARDHGDERTSAWRIDPDGQESGFDEALVSTQYDGDGRPTRVGLELWPGEDSPPTRVACSLIGGEEAGGLWAGFARCSIDGSEGLGTYLLRRE